MTPLTACMPTGWLAVMLASACMVAHGGHADSERAFLSASRDRQDGGNAPATPPKVPEPSPPPAADKPPAKPKSLDDLLGVPATPSGAGSDAASSTEAAEAEQRRRLEKSLAEASMEDLVTRAIGAMKGAAERLSDQKDAGLGTQRLQEDALRSIDRLLEEAQRQQQQQRSQSRSSSRQQRSSSDDPSESSQPSGQRQQGRQQGGTSTSGESGESEPPPPEDGSASDSDLSESRIEWGRLPDRIREMVLQGRRDRVSSVYERLTREYYRRLAEEASR